MFVSSSPIVKALHIAATSPPTYSLISPTSDLQYNTIQAARLQSAVQGADQCPGCWWVGWDPALGPVLQSSAVGKYSVICFYHTSTYIDP